MANPKSLSPEEVQAEFEKLSKDVDSESIEKTIDAEQLEKAIQKSKKQGSTSKKKASKKALPAADHKKDPLAALRKVSKDMEQLGNVMSEDEVEEWIDTGHLGLNYLVSGRWVDGGYPRGKVAEFFGPSGSAKSTLCYIAGANIQRAGGIFATLDSEGAYNVPFLKRLGMDPEQAVRLTPRDKDGDEYYSVEACFKAAKEFITLLRSNEYEGPILILLDSIAACPLEEEWVAMKAGKSIPEDQGRKAKLVGQWQRVLNSFIRGGDNTLHIINQLRTDRRTGADVTTSGRATEYTSDTRISIKRRKMIARTTFINKPGEGTGDDWKFRQLGGFFRVRCDKSRQTSPHRVLPHMELYYEKGIAPLSSIFDLLATEEYFIQSGSRYFLTDPATRNSARPMKDESVPSFFRKDVEEGDWLFDNAEKVFGCSGEELANYVKRWEDADRFSQELKLVAKMSKKELKVLDDETGDDSESRDTARPVDALAGGWRSKIAKSKPTIESDETRPSE